MLNTIIACLALNIYFEARDQPIEGQVAVTQVAINRVNDPRFPNSHCEVIKEGPVRNGLPIIGKCQFSWYCDGLKDIPTDQDAYRWAIMIAIRVLDENYEDFVDGSTHYHADHVSPIWSTEKTRVVKIGNHIFYRWERKKEMNDTDHEENAPKQQSIIEQRVASGIPVAHCLKCGWWIADGATAGNECPECNDGNLRLWKNASDQREIE